MLNRKETPVLSGLSTPTLLSHDHQTLSNGIELVLLHDENQEVFKLDVVFESGAWYQSHPLVASTMLNMLNEGTTAHNSEAIADVFDYYGAYVDFNCGMHKSELNMISLNKYAGETINLLAEMARESIFPEKELEIYLRNKRQEHLTDREKTSWLARKEFSKQLFGEKHPYANVIDEKDYDRIDRETLYRFYQEHIHARNCRIILSGNVTPAVLEETQKAFATLHRPEQNIQSPQYAIQAGRPGRYHVHKADAVQSSIRIGKAGVHLTHEDYAGFQLMNTILGGYFGSRLMSNIREDKGYTYGISSYNVSLPTASFWAIATDVNQDHTEATIRETFSEIERLQQELVPEEELQLVKNYLHGDLLRELDGVFSQSDALKHKLNYGLDNQFYITMINRINQSSPEELRDLAKKYLNPDEMYIVVAGA